MDYDIVFVTNASNQRAAISRRELRLLGQIKHYGVEICETEYRHRTLARTASYFASYYVLDAIEAIAHEERLCILSDVDCIWADAQRLFQAAADEQGVGSVQLTYPLDWDVNGYSPANLAQLGRSSPQ